MSCGGSLTGLVLAAAGGMVTNGTLPSTFGGAPLSSVAGAPLSLTDAATGLTNFAPTLSTMSGSLNNITGTVLSGAGGSLSGVLSTLDSAGLTSSMIGSWNNIASSVNANGLMDAISGFSPDLSSTLTSITGSTSLNNALGYAGEWSGKVLGGTGSLTSIVGDPKKFGGILSTAQSYISSANELINSAVNSANLGTTFTGLNNIVSGGLAGVNLDFGGFGEELTKLGGAIDFSNIDSIGSPGQLLANLGNQGTLGPLYNKLNEIDVDSRIASALGVSADFTGTVKLGELGVDLNSLAQQGSGMPEILQTKVFETFASLDLDEVDQVKSILGTTQNAIETGEDLFDPTKLFPNSFETLQAPLRTASVGFRSIYTNGTGSVNPLFDSLGNKLRGILPDNIAVANGALARSLGQVKGITNSTPTALGSSLEDLETLKDLDLLENQETYVTDAIKTYWTDTYGTDSTDNISLATGNAGQYKLSDVIGFAAGYNSAAPLKHTENLLQEMKDADELDDIIGSNGVYATIIAFCGDTWTTDNGTEEVSATEWYVTIPASYMVGYITTRLFSSSTSATAAREACWAHITSAIASVLNTFTSNTRAVTIASNSTRWNEQLIREYRINEKMNQDLDTVFSSDDIAINFAFSLPSQGLDTSEGGSAELLERIMNYDSLGGQAAIAAMREGRNQVRLNTANVQQDGFIDTTAVEDPAQLSTAQYTSAEALDRVIKS